ncbi:MAG: ABC transporter ATP-binding protein [Prolixibacteraceae bacterium]|jgi:ABC-type multidrug transport system ATPase subunit
MTKKISEHAGFDSPLPRRGLGEALSVSIQNISKSYKDVQAITNISLEINKGELFGLIGPDGAGKTTLMRILMTLLIQDEGTATMAGLDVVKDYKKIRRIVGYMPGRFSLYQDLTVEENLNFFATVFNTTVEANYDLIRDIYVQIEPFKKRKAGKLSGGMKQKLALSCALIHKPEILVLDEPTTGVDAVSRKEFWEMLKKLQQKGITILVSTPYMDEATLCNRVALMQKGKVLDVDTPQKLVENYTRKLYAIRSKDMHRLIQDLRSWDKTDSAYAFGQYLHVTGKEDEVEASEFENFLLKKNHEMLEVFDIHPGIEDVFMNMMNE